MSPLVEYLREAYLIHYSRMGVKEESYYPALANLLNRVGARLKPSVHAVLQLQDVGAGKPDLGLLTRDQVEGPARDAAKAGVLPARGVVEAKGTAADLDTLLKSAQVMRYHGRYGQVLVTNLRAFALLGRDATGHPVVVERLELAETEGGFWAMAAHADRLEDTEREAEVEAFFERCLRYGAPLDRPRDLAAYLAAYAREGRARLDRLAREPGGLSALASLRDALQETLGVRFDGEQGERFFRATVVQTVFYGVFSAWTLWHREHPNRTEPFSWYGTPGYLHLPVLKRLFAEVVSLNAQKLGLTDLLNRTAQTLDRVDRGRFFARFDAEADAIQYFYEPFLEAYDPALRKQLGVWYTPPELVRYIVARVDEALRDELGIEDGLADPRVVVLDPACGTGAFLVEVLRHIRRTLETQGLGATLGQRLRKAATERLFGFEILTAPFVVAHLQIGLALRAAGVPLAEGQRAAVYLTNALTGWKPAKDEGQHRLSQEFEAEVEAARHVKRQEKILVVLGNPPYKGQPGLAIEEEREVVEAYRQTVRPEVPKPDGRGLDDLYVRFFRIAERQIAKHTRRGVVAYVTNNSWLDGTSHTAMRERFLDAFDQIWIDNLNGDQKKTGKRTPDGAPDPSIFSTPSNREGIKPGTAVALLTRREDHEGSTATIRYRDFWGADKLTTLDALAKDGSLSGLGVGAPEYAEILPEPALGLPFLPRHVTADYLRWPNLPDLFPTHFPGIQTARDEALVDVDASRLESRMRTYFDPETSDSDAARATPVLLKKTKRFDPLKTRRILKESGYETGYIIPYLYRPFDIRWLYWVNITKLLDEKRSDYLNHMLDNNIWLASQQKPRRDWSPPQIAHAVGCLDVMDRGASFIPLYLAPDLTTGGAVRPNLSRRALDYLKETGATPEDLFHHALAVLHSPSYRADNAGALRQDWPRIPLPSDPSALATTAALGRQLATLLAPETPVSGVTTGSIRPDLRSVAEPARLAGGMLDETAGHTRVTAPWGRFGHTGKVMPGKGKLFPRPLPAAVPPALGPSALDVYLNDDTLWRTVPDRVWAYTLGGYPVLKKWLSYRTEVVLGRPLRLEEVEEFARIARRIAAILLLESELDAGYAAI